jgi:hypothetical protein
VRCGAAIFITIPAMGQCRRFSLSPQRPLQSAMNGDGSAFADAGELFCAAT